MLKSPSTRRNKPNKSQISPNLVPVIDAMVTLVGFLLYTTTFLQFVSVETLFPEASQKEVEQKLKEKPLQLTISIRERDTEIWSPFSRISPKHLTNEGPGQPNVKALHDALVQVKKQFPGEDKVVLAPDAGVSYENLVAVMDSIRTMDAGDPPLFTKNLKTGMDDAIKFLFPDIIFGNLLGDN